MSTNNDDDACHNVIRSIRFRKDHYNAIMRAAKKRGLDFSQFVRQASLDAAGIGKAEIARLEKQVKNLASIATDLDAE